MSPSMSPATSRSTNRFVLWRSPLALGPILVLGAFVFRSLTPLFDTTVALISGVLIVVVAFMLVGQRWSGFAFLVLPVALFTSPAGREFSFNLSAVDNPIWRWHSIVGLLSVGVGSVAAVFVARGRPPRNGHHRLRLVANMAGGVGLGGLMIVAMSALFPHPGFGQAMSNQKIDSLPVIEMLNYAYDVPKLQASAGNPFSAVVKNSTNLPHTITIESLDIDLYVPAGRFSVIEIGPDEVNPRGSRIPMYCTVGEHRTLGMERTLDLAVRG
jgi:hypothetical protein